MTLQPGHYTLAMSADGNFTGSFAFALRSLASATALTLNQTQSGTLNPGDRTDLYKFTATAGQQVFFDVQSGGSDTWWRLFAPDGTQVFGQAGFSDRGLTTLNQGGIYTLLIEGRFDNSSPTAYSFRVVSPTNASGTVTLGTAVNGSLDLPGQADSYTFTLAASTLLYIDPQTNNGNLYWSLQGPRGTIASSQFRQSDAYSRGDGDPVAFLAPAGDYTLIVNASNDATSPYSITVDDVASATLVTLGTTITGTLNPGNGTAMFRFKATAGDRYYFDMKSIGGDGRWRLIDPAGLLVQNATSYYTDFQPPALPLTGTYTLLLEGGIDYTGPTAYSFSIDPIVDQTNAAALNTRVDLSIDLVVAETRFYVHACRRNEHLHRPLAPANNGFVWTLTGPTGTVASRRFAQSDGYDFNGNPLLDLAAGTYTLSVTADNGGTGAFSFRLLDAGAATAITPGTPVSGSINPNSETDIYKLDGHAGDRLFFDEQAYSGGSLYWRLIDPFGNVAFQQGFGDTGTITLPSDGTYFLLLEGRIYDGAGSSSYRYAVYDNALSAPVHITNLESLPGPDLTVSGVGVSATGAVQSGGDITITWLDNNAGTLPVTTSWTDRVLVRRADTNEVIGEAQLSYDPAAQGNAALASGGSLQRQLNCAYRRATEVPAR